MNTHQPQDAAGQQPDGFRSTCKGKPRKTGKRVSEAEFRRMWEDMSISISEIGRRLGISCNAAKCRAKRRGLPDRPVGRPFARTYDHAKFVALYRSGLSMHAVARLMGCAEHTVLKALKRAGEPSRPRKDPMTTNSPAAALLAARAREEQAAFALAEMVDGRRTGGDGRRAA